MDYKQEREIDEAIITVERMRSIITDLEDENSKLQDEVDVLKEENVKLNDEIQKLLEIIDKIPG